ncbi:MAG TPA: DUF4276 family protein [Novimethylophilus sp.]|uniref:DUF4276 family protein n=1 Tax=Novimethylophilus sp. TaxID=2137426 RepID=UPI002F416D69
MTAIASIVEGDGEVAALPVLIRRLMEWQKPGRYADMPPPIRVHRDRFLNKDEEFRRHLLLAAGKCGENGCILVLLDADDDCPATRGIDILTRAQAVVPHRRISVVLANREYEAWFIAAAQSLHGHRGFEFNAAEAINAELPRNAKGWLGERMSSKAYRETTDQPAFSALMDLQQAFNNSRSFRKLYDELKKQIV